MSSDELAEAIHYDLEAMRVIVHELSSLAEEVHDREITIREKAAAGAFLAQFYSGVENILKRISYFHGTLLPEGEAWHRDLLLSFCESGHGTLPKLLDESLLSDINPYRRFRHVVHHGYGFELEWDRMKFGIDRARPIFERFEKAVQQYLNRIAPE